MSMCSVFSVLAALRPAADSPFTPAAHLVAPRFVTPDSEPELGAGSGDAQVDREPVGRLRGWGSR